VRNRKTTSKTGPASRVLRKLASRRAAATEDPPADERPDDLGAKPWWRKGYGRIVTVLGVIGVIFTLAQLPTKVAGLPGTFKDSINVIHDVFFRPSHAYEISAARIGNFVLVDDSSLGAALRAFGKPGVRRHSEGSCEVDWPERGLETSFVTSSGNPCSLDHGFFCQAAITGPRWKTPEGLKVGDSLTRLRSLYPNAKQVEGGFLQEWQLEPGTLPCPVSTEKQTGVNGLRARSIGEHIQEFDVYYNAIGE